MLFNSIEYLLFLPAVLSVYWLISSQPRRNLFLLVASLFFYGFWDWRFLGLIFLSAGVDYTVALKMEGAHPRRRKALLMIGLCSDLTILGFFKYFNFFVDSGATLLGMAGIHVHRPALNILLPAGISFYTFQALSYTIDVYRGNLKASRNPVTFFLFIAFFPHLVAGPINRAGALLEQFEREAQPLDVARVHSALMLILVGLFKKVVLADTAATLANRVFSTPTAFSGLANLLASYAFAFQIYGDFSGYSDIARGSSRLFGIELTHNFYEPYLSRNITEFWQRWHISLSTWLRDYLYIPLGGNRGGAANTYRNLMIVMLLGGLWHGASWTFVVWGGLHGLFLAIHRWRSGARPPVLGDEIVWKRDIFKILGTFHLVGLSWIFFRADSFTKAWQIITRMVTLAKGGTPIHAVVLPFVAVAMLAVDLAARKGLRASRLIELEPAARGLVYGVLAVGLLVFWGNNTQPFIYFQF